jgi:hypothetical protein
MDNAYSGTARLAFRRFPEYNGGKCQLAPQPAAAFMQPCNTRRDDVHILGGQAE